MSNKPTQKVSGGFVKARNAREHTECWISKNPEAWAFIKRQARRLAAQKQHTSVRLITETVRYSHDWQRTGNDMFTLNNTITPALARILIEQIPEMKPFIETRSSKCDQDFRNGPDEQEEAELHS